ncbi:transporter substrate-binding domain-containing protein [Pseudomonas sp. V1]|uniref:substrate-binding periplasmic protein n=1 Tax=Pseudomonas arcuscaelestis TaxID=2710591 RepID=UPI00193F7FDE|nr:transporter substrate-binding domain-containing protein [Pseudomonas arcuscaelestis]MBM3108652.1 transporter substrate-binding domain-containing protein [Pseudomonas arcuscaelestis]
MRWVLNLLMLYIGQLGADELPPLRFAVADSWTMPLVHIENNRPVDGIMFDMMNALAVHTGHRPEFVVIPRLRLPIAMERGSVDVRCFVMPAWADDAHNNYSWSKPLFKQRDLLVTLNPKAVATNLTQIPRQAIGTVLGFKYPVLQPQFDNGHFERDDARNQLQVLHKLQAGRYSYAVSSQLSLDWFNRQLPAEQRLKGLAVLEEQQLGCMVLNAPPVPTQTVLRTLAKMKQSGEIERIFQRYGSQPTSPLPPN